MKKKKILLSIFLFTTNAFCLYFLFSSSFYFRKDVIKTKALITDKKYIDIGDVTGYEYTFSFYDSISRKEYNVTPTILSNISKPLLGDSVEVVYIPHKPIFARLNYWDSILVRDILLFILFFAISFSIYRIALKYPNSINMYF